jgi:hypothetical protein
MNEDQIATVLRAITAYKRQEPTLAGPALAVTEHVYGRMVVAYDRVTKKAV